MKSSHWLIRSPQASRKLRLYCFSYAGGGANAFSSWQADFGPDIEICAIELPGRGMRMAEAPFTSLPNLIVSLAKIIAAENAAPFAFFGHSLGGLVAFELTRFCARNALPMPTRLIVSGTDAPQSRSPSKNLHKMPNDELIEALGGYNGTPPEVLENRELMELVLPTIRADFSLAENYEYKIGLPLSLPIVVFAGKLDDHLSLEQVAAWQKETSNECQVHWFEGDHFYINTEKELLIECLKAELALPKLNYPSRSLEITAQMVEELKLRIEPIREICDAAEVPVAELV
jgi:surfactin synthase thioesterase subunit